jgi:hypothetical protein
LSKTLPDDASLAKTQKLLAALPRSCLTPAIQQDQVDAQKSLQQDLANQEKQTPPPADAVSAPKHRHSSSSSDDR